MKQLMLAMALLASGAQALTVSGSVTGAAPRGARIAAWTVNATGAPLASLTDAPLNGSAFDLDLPEGAPGARAVSALRSDTLVWPGVVDPVNVSAPVNAAEVKFFVYTDANGNGRRDANEDLNEVTPLVGRAQAVVVWADNAARVTAGRGFDVNLKPGWNAFAVEFGRATKVTSLGARPALQFNLGSR
ncbi:hypothetical protein [Deinococcus maricopensis]|uniref:Uncharacterized protein n=1 Tax=Deinococcus maricopensis (strain DSM 21211 / LMG 22137 / NRRL B-23946 / LB-34) TaxID=709986 RepID=E8U9A7_DEIML|nr:hypothetical protein [Deinococcus maricopensis]ADV67646.1 hypothetical protein Deima_2001 [Deinococcus maricopensis DSM 21211]